MSDASRQIGRCYAARKGEACDRITAEHPIPKAVLRAFVAGNAVSVRGFQWGSIEEAQIGLGNLTAKVLCGVHNAALAGLDAELALLQAAIEEVEAAMRRGDIPTGASFDGPRIERALLKVALGAVAGRWLGIRETGEVIESFDAVPHHHLVDLLHGRRRFGPRQGLYVDLPKEAVAAPANFWLHPITKNGALSQFGVGIRHVMFWLAVSTVPKSAQRRPSALVFAQNDRASRLVFRWGLERHTGEVSMFRAGSMDGWFDYPQPKFE